MQLDILTAIDEARANRDAGMLQAVNHADSAPPYNWSEKAFNYLKEYIRCKPKGFFFMLEDVRMKAERERAVPEPPHKRAWGAIILKAVKAGMIKKCGYGQVKNPNANMANAAVWMVV